MSHTKIDSWVHFFSECPDAKIRVFCFHYSGGNAYVFRDWAASIPNEMELCAIQLPGRMNLSNLEPLEQFEDLIKPLCGQLLPYLKEKPFIFFGHSLGALIAYSLSHYLLESYNLIPDLLMVSACASPKIRKSGEPVHLLPDHELIQKLYAYNDIEQSGVHELIKNTEFMRFMLPVLRADFSLSATYRYLQKSPLDIPIFAYGGSQDSQVPLDAIKAWKTETTKRFSYSIFEGGHFFIKTQQLEFLKTLSQDLNASFSN